MFENNICRTCLQIQGDLISISALVDDETLIFNCFNNCMKITIKEGDELPQVVCLNCLDNVLEVRKFYIKCIESENYLKQKIYENTKNTEKNEEEENEYFENTDEKFFETQSDGKIQCSICKENFKFKKNLNYHMKILHDKECDNKIQSDTDKIYKKKFKCNICQYNFEFENNFNKHMNRHIQENLDKSLIECNYHNCNKTFLGKTAMELHFKKFHSESLKILLCQICGITLKNIKTYNRHKERHTKPGETLKKFKCSYCDKGFYSNHHRIAHERIHTKERPFVCKFCGKSFSQSSILNTHIQIHTGKKINCPLCDKKFSGKGFLSVHMRTHTQERPYKCDMCSQKYTQMCHLKTHILNAHSNERPYKCEICNKCFPSKELLKYHIYKHMKPYKCPSCNLETASTVWFRKHLKRAHGIEDDIKKFKVDVRNSISNNEESINFLNSNEYNDNV